MARNVWNALKNDQGLPVGTTYTDGNGAQLVVPDPTAATASPSPAPTDDTTTSPSDDSNGDSTTNPADNTEQSASVTNNAANQAAAEKNAESCPPKDK